MQLLTGGVLLVLQCGGQYFVIFEVHAEFIVVPTCNERISRRAVLGAGGAETMSHF